MRYNPKKIESKWRRIWEREGAFRVRDRVPGKENYYHLVMFPYPSGDLHIGHWYNFAPADVFARFLRMRGKNVLSPIGFDAFGLPAENAAIAHKIHPRIWTERNIRRMRKQLKSMGTIYDWSREVNTSDPAYYRWTQWLFLQFHKLGLAYRAEVPANWCTSCKTVLANEQVVGGSCERCESEVIQKNVTQWLLKITAYAERLLDDIEELDWPEETKTMQRNWIGRSEGADIDFGIKGIDERIRVFTTRPDTLFGATHLVLAPEHPFVERLTTAKRRREVEAYRRKTEKKTERERISEEMGKTGAFTGSFAVNPVNNKSIPIWISDYVLATYGTGAIMAVPAHDARDFDFARTFRLPVIEVISPDGRTHALTEAYEREGTLIHSGTFNGMHSEKAKHEIVRWLAGGGFAQKRVHYRLRDWIISRQRYWGVPIPIIHCPQCGEVPVPEKHLPVRLPPLRDFRPSADGRSPLAKSPSFMKTRCLRCRGMAERETDTMDTFVDSSWYFIRYADPRNSRRLADPQKLAAWLPVDMYIGGKEHTVLHLLYSRFFTKALADAKVLNFWEPFRALRHQGIILGSGGQKMSKSRGNVVDPDELVRAYGSDTVRMHLCFMGPYSQGGPWNPSGIQGMHRFLGRIWGFFQDWSEFSKGNPSPATQRLLHQTIRKVGDDIEHFRFNTAISALMVFANHLAVARNKCAALEFLKLLAPFAPYTAEEIWSACIGEKGSVHGQRWPEFKQELAKEESFVLIVQINGKVRDRIPLPRGANGKRAMEAALASPRIKAYILGKEIKKRIFVPDRLINFVV